MISLHNVAAVPLQRTQYTYFRHFSGVTKNKHVLLDACYV